MKFRRATSLHARITRTLVCTHRDTNVLKKIADGGTHRVSRIAITDCESRRFAEFLVGFESSDKLPWEKKA